MSQNLPDKASAAPPRSDPAGADAQDVKRLQRRTMIVLVISQVIGTIGVGVAPSIGVLLAGEVTNSEAWAGLARTASTLGAAVLGLPLGNLAARRGRRIALSSGWWTAAAGGALLLAAAQWILIVPLFVGLLMIGAGAAVTLQARFAATDLAAPHRKGRSLALIVWVGTLGSVLGPNLGLPGQIVADRTGLTTFASAFGIAAICLALAGLITFALLRPDPLSVCRHARPQERTTTPAVARGRISQVRTELRTNRRARYALVAILTAQAVMVSIMTMTPVHLSHHGGSITIVGLTISLHIAGMYALAPLVGLLSDRWGSRPPIAIGIGVFLASLIIGALFPYDIGWVIVALILLGVGWSFVNVAGSALFSAVVSPHTRASSQGGVDALANLCGATAAFAAGPLLAVSSFSFLSVLAIALLIPLTVLTSLRAR